MTNTITFQMSHSSLPPGKVEGFRYLWAFYVKGYDPAKHCQKCFRGRRVTDFCTPTARSGTVVDFDRMDRYQFVYVCGVGIGPEQDLWSQNLHLPMRYKEGGTIEDKTYNNYIYRAHNAELVEVPPLPEGWHGLPRNHTRCKNFQFAVGAFGPPKL